MTLTGEMVQTNKKIEGKTPLQTPTVEKEIELSTEKTIDTSSGIPEKSFKDYLFISIVCLMIAFGGVVFGYDTGTIPGFINMSDFVNRFGQQGQDGAYLSNVRTGLLIAILHIGCTLGGLIVSKVADIYGRRIALMTSMGIYIIGITIQISSISSWVQYVVGRFVAGLAIGTLMVVAPMMISETAPKKVRGTLVCCFQLMITLGMLIGYCVTYGTRHLEGPKQWRVALSLGYVWAAVLVSGMVFMPESPRFLVEKNRISAAKRSIARANNADPEDPEVMVEVQLIQAGISGENQSGDSSWKELVTGQPRIFERVLMGIVLQSLQQLTGVNYFFYFGTTIFNAVGLDDSFLTSIVLGLVNFLATFVGVYAIDKLGRRMILLGGSIAMLLCFVAESTLGSTNLYITGYDGPTNKPTGNAMIFLSCLFIFFFAASWAGGALTITSEAYPSRIRSKGMSVAISFNWMSNFLIAFFTPFIAAKIHFYYGFVFSGFLLASIFYVYFFVPETKGLTLEEVDELYRQNIKPWKSHKWVPPTVVHSTPEIKV